MIDIKPFKALRPTKKDYPAIASLPYDVMTGEEAREMVAKQPLSFLRIIRSEVELPNDIDPYSETVYNKAKENLENLRKDGHLIQDNEPCFYIYRLKKGDFSQTGLIAVVSVLDYEKDIIKKHEKTRIDKENDRIRHIKTLNTQTGTVFLTYKSKDSLNEILKNAQKEEPTTDFETDDGITHTLWVINDQKILDNIVTEFKNIPALYIADGHHRAASALNVYKQLGTEDSKYFLSIIYPHDSLKILPYNRGVKDLNGHTQEEFLKKIEENFTIKKADANSETTGYAPEVPRSFGMYMDNQWYLLEAKDNIPVNDDPVSTLDVSLLQNYILDPILGIKDPRADKRIDFFGGVRGTAFLKKIVDSGEFKIAFSMFPTSIEQLMAVADENKLMPPKSTWFEPKPRSGMAIHNFG